MKRAILMILALLLQVQVAWAAPVTVDLRENFPNHQGENGFNAQAYNVSAGTYRDLTRSGDYFFNTPENVSRISLGFLMNRYARFQNYFSGENPEPAKDKIFLNNIVLMMDDNEFDQFISELRGLLAKYNFEFAHGRKARDISVISAPALKE